ncbi:MAG: hypothetical protein C7B46_09050 [Sulfobacillus benefaciens]|uniref:AMP-dependent synthetase/ligase domain-containing protein n=1 Tax=Sulfobacillus benefaciens TaxID=453960 RepID=A0A2T2XGW6_9FIRM|nr:MAG: hypothetical protein C7B46_09050 [Sulfobacillus benefaciens]
MEKIPARLAEVLNQRHVWPYAVENLDHVPIMTRKDYSRRAMPGGVRLLRSRRSDVFHYWPYGSEDLANTRPVWEWAATLAGIGADARVVVALDNDDARSLWAEGMVTIGRTVLAVRPENLSAGMKALQPTVLVTSPLLAYQAVLGQMLDGIDLLILTGSVGGGPGLRQKIHHRYPTIQIRQLYYIGEFSAPLAAECANGGLHWTTVGAEIEFLAVDRDETAHPGARARVVVSDLTDRAQPLLRYDTGDLVQVVASDCSCGAGGVVTHPLVLGKLENAPMVFGSRLYPGDFVEAIWGADGTGPHIGANVRLDRGRSKDQVTVCFEALPGFDLSHVKQSIADRFRKTFGFVPEVTTNFPPDFQPLLYVRDFRTGTGETSQ